ncbi:hypothetical protein CKA32_003609 [Geitlerinema sp. FC II]|nr:hypothetical protein CKA32_003609 [Geitlerinema sp. FC II]
MLNRKKYEKNISLIKKFLDLYFNYSNPKSYGIRISNTDLPQSDKSFSVSSVSLW